MRWNYIKTPILFAGFSSTKGKGERFVERSKTSLTPQVFSSHFPVFRAWITSRYPPELAFPLTLSPLVSLISEILDKSNDCVFNESALFDFFFIKFPNMRR